MRCTGPLGYILSGSAVLALLAGCSGGGSSSPTPLSAQGTTTQSTLRTTSSFARSRSTSVARLGAQGIGIRDLSAGFADPDASSTATVIISDAEADDVYAYSADKLVATITGFSEPQGLAANTAGDIYIADTVNSRVVEYKNDYKTKLATFTDANQYPAGVDIDNTTGVLGVTNIISTADGDGSVSFYAKGKTSKPCKTVTNSNWARVYFGAFGPSGNFFVDGEGVNGDVLVGEVKGECSATTITTLTTSNAIEFPGGVQVDAKGNILVDDQEGFVIYAYKAPVGTKLGAPVATTALNGAGDPVTFSLNKAETTVWTADASLVEGLAYRFPAGGSKVNSIAGPPFEQPIGVVVTPLAPN
jgi:hypothetical protein